MATPLNLKDENKHNLLAVITGTKSFTSTPVAYVIRELADLGVLAYRNDIHFMPIECKSYLNFGNVLVEEIK